MEQQLNSSTGGWIGDDRRDEADFTSVSQTNAKTNVKCWCFLCHIELIEEKDKLEMHGETVCSQCWDDNMYMAL